MEDSPKKIAVVILCWNGRMFLEEFLPSLIEHQTPDSDIIVADNKSEDDSVDFVRKNFPSVRIILLEKNFGFAEGYNQAIKRINSEFVVLLNQDVAVTSNWLHPLVKVMEQDQKIAAVQPKIKSHLKRTHFEYAGACGGWIDSYGYTFCRGRIFDTIEEDRGQYDAEAEIFWASGACMLTRKSIYEQLGGLDADLFAHMEEIDLCWRMKNAGYKIMCCPATTIYHLGGGSLTRDHPFKTYLNFRNNLGILIKNLPAKNLLWMILFRMLLDYVAAFRSLLIGHFKDFIAIIRAELNFLFHIRKWLRKRSSNASSLNTMTGVLNGSVAWRYFMQGKKKFTDIKPVK